MRQLAHITLIPQRIQLNYSSEGKPIQGSIFCGCANSVVTFMSEMIKLRGSEYPVEKFTDAHVQCLQELLVQGDRGEWMPSSFSRQCQAAEIVLEVICPTLPDTVISITPRGKYVWQLSLVELPYIALQIVRIHRIRQLAIAKTRKARAEVSDHQEWIARIDGYLRENELLIASTLGEQSLGESGAIDVGNLEPAAPGARGDLDRISWLEMELAQLKAAESAKDSSESVEVGHELAEVLS